MAFKPNLRLLHKGLILVLVPLAVQLIFFGMLWHLLQRADYENRRISHAKEVSTAVTRFYNMILSSGDSLFSYKLSHVPMLDANEKFTPQQDQQFKENFKLDFEKIPATLEAIGSLVDTPEEKAAFSDLQEHTQKFLLLMLDGLRKIEKRERLTDFDSYVLVKSYAGEVRFVKSAADRLAQIELQVENEAPQKEAASREMVMNWILAGLFVDFAVAAGLALYFNNDLLERLKVLMENTNRLARNAPLLPRTAGGDEIEHLDKVFHEMASALNEASEYKKELVSMVSHDLRTPLTSIQTSLALMEIGACGDLPERALHEISVAERSASRLINLINDLLDIEKMEAGKLQMNLQTASSRSIIEQSIEAVGAFAEQHAVIFKLPSTDFQLVADSERLVQVLVNLLSNAIKFSPDASTITLDVVETGGAYQFSVSDQGRGIPPEYKDSMFQRFKQVDGVKSTKIKGTGLGLAICKAIVEGHEGDIGFDSEVGKGTTFWFRIPRKLSVVAEQPKVVV